MKRRTVAALLVLATVTAACGGASEPTATPSAQSVEKAALQLIADLGSADAAADAVIIAMDRGYSGNQILAGVDTARLERDGTIQGDSPAGAPLDLVLYSVQGQGEGEGASPSAPNSGEVVLVAAFQITKTPIERLRQNATRNLGVGEPAVAMILTMLDSGFEPRDVIEILILGIDRFVDDPSDPDGPAVCMVVVDELYCPFGDRYPAPGSERADEGDAVGGAPDATESAGSGTASARLLWEGELTPDPQWVENPVSGTYILTRTAGTDGFQISFSTTDAKEGTFTTDGFNEVECTSEWTSVFEGTGTFWDINDLGIEFEGQITRSIVYTSGPCGAGPEPETSDFGGVVVFITETGIESSFNAWSFSVDGDIPVPIGD